MRKISVSIFFIILVSLPSFGDTAAYISAVSGVEMKDEPSTDSKTIFTLRYAAQVNILEKIEKSETIGKVTSNWTKIRFGKITGWIFGDNLVQQKPKSIRSFLTDGVWCHDVINLYFKENGKLISDSFVSGSLVTTGWWSLKGNRLIFRSVQLYDSETKTSGIYIIEKIGYDELVICAEDESYPTVCRRSELDLHKFIREKDVRKAKRYLEDSPNIQGSEAFNDCIATLAYRPSVEMAKLLIQYKIDPAYTYNADNFNILHGFSSYEIKSAKEEKTIIEIIDLFIDSGVDINMNSIKGTPLLYALKNNNYGIAEHLIIKGADVNIPDNNGITPLKVSKAKGNSKITDLLIQKGAK